MIAASNLFSLATLVHDLVTVGVKNGTSLLVAALQVWLTNVTVFGLAYWELDRGGPVSRTQAPREELPMADFRFSQDENDDAVQEAADGSSVTSDRVPTLTDYLDVSVTNSRLQTHRHHAAVHPRQALDEHPEHRRPASGTPSLGRSHACGGPVEMCCPSPASDRRPSSTASYRSNRPLPLT